MPIIPVYFELTKANYTMIMINFVIKQVLKVFNHIANASIIIRNDCKHIS